MAQFLLACRSRGGITWITGKRSPAASAPVRLPMPARFNRFRWRSKQLVESVWERSSSGPVMVLRSSFQQAASYRPPIGEAPCKIRSRRGSGQRYGRRSPTVKLSPRRHLAPEGVASGPLRVDAGAQVIRLSVAVTSIWRQRRPSCAAQFVAGCRWQVSRRSLVCRSGRVVRPRHRRQDASAVEQ